MPGRGYLQGLCQVGTRIVIVPGSLGRSVAPPRHLGLKEVRGILIIVIL